MKEIRLQGCLEPGRLEAGCDEAGRGPLAGPVYAAAVILPPGFYHPLLNDSKQMTEKAREELRPFGRYGFKDFRTVVHGDATFASIAAASVLAKTYRDEFMRKLAAEYPEYGWDRNMGYPTPGHIEAIRRYGYTPWHRKSFHVKELEPSLF